MAQVTPAPPTGEREGARRPGYVRFRDEAMSLMMNIEAKCTDPDWTPDPVTLAFVTATLEDFYNRGKVAAAPTQPGEGEVWDVLAGVLEDAEAHHPSGDYTRARALLERRGKGLSGKGDGR